jgi:exosortase A-associated hydrolase 2
VSGADCTPYFLESPQGGLFAVHHRPAGSVTPLGNMLCVAPFNEEMNRCRSMITLQARAWAALGWGTLLIDLHGTGDSAGEYVDARWSLWRQNLDAAWQWLERQPGGCRGVWGLRLGAILASELHASHGDASVRLLLWQPVLDGKTHLTQFMRVKIAAQIDRPDLPKATTNGMRAQLAAGESIEIAGYEIHPELAQAIDSAKLADHRPAAGTPVMWIENAAPEQAELAPASRALLEKWSAADVRVSSMACAGPAFWQVHERVLTPSFIDASTAWLAKFPDSARAAA